jgi:uncharacterized membrane protein
MIQLHTSHGWLRPEARAGVAWDAAQFFGGLAAPLFLFLAGAGLGLQWSQASATGREASPYKSVAGGIELVVVGYALRLQMWIVDGAAYARGATYPALALLTIGYALAYWGTVRLARAERARAWLISGCALALAGVLWAQQVDPRRAEGLLRVDALQCIGMSRILLSLVGTRTEHRRSLTFFALAAAVALITPLQQSWVPGPLPEALAGYVAQWPGRGPRALALFPLFPWLSFAAAGVAIGLLWGRPRQQQTLEAQLVRTITAGAIIALLINESWPPARWLPRVDALVSLLRVTYKTALCLVMIGPALACARGLRLLNAPLQTFGRASLLVYCAHLEFAFGTVSRPLARRLSTPQWVYGTAALMLAMWALAALRTSGLTPRRVINTLLKRPLVTG